MSNLTGTKMNTRYMTLIKVSTFVYFMALLIFHTVHGISGDFLHGKFKLAYILKVVQNFGPKMCVLECARIQGCNGINYDQSHLYCEVLLGTTSDAVIDKPGYKFAEMEQWTIDNDVCYPNPCRYLQKCVITNNNIPVCLKIKQHKWTNCASIKKIFRATRDGLYKVQIDGNDYLHCDMTTDKGGWMIFQQRIDGSVDFYRGWLDYKTGFGHLDGEFWLGNEKLHVLTMNMTCELRIDLEKIDGTKGYAVYSTFRIGDEASGYKITVDHYSGNAAYQMKLNAETYVVRSKNWYLEILGKKEIIQRNPEKILLNIEKKSCLGHGMSVNNEQKFSTFDNDHSNGCASRSVGAWWYSGCTYSNLNGEYLAGPTNGLDEHRGIMWHPFSGFHYSLKRSKMMIRPKN